MATVARIRCEATGSAHGDFIDWLTIQNQAKSVVTDVERIKIHPLVPKSIPIYGYVYQVETGRLVEIPKRPRSAAQRDVRRCAGPRRWPRLLRRAIRRRSGAVQVSEAIQELRFFAAKFVLRQNPFLMQAAQPF